MHIDTAELRESRQDLQRLARAQSGVDTLREHFPGSREIPGVRDAGAASGSTGSRAAPDNRTDKAASAEAASSPQPSR